MNILTFTTTEIGMRLDRMLQQRFPSFSRAYIQKEIKAGRVHVNGAVVAPHHFLRAKDHVTEMMETPRVLLCTPNAKLTIPVIEETDEYCVIDKPSGITAHQSPAHPESDTVANWFLAHTPSAQTVGDNPLRPGIVHRLDRDVSGVMILAKTEKMFLHVKQSFQERRVEKIYTALVYGTVDPSSGTIDLPIARSSMKEGRMAARTPSDKATKDTAKKKKNDEKEAMTEYTIIKQYTRYALLEVRPKTGRTHQIRVHLYAIGHPIVGDTLYHPKTLPRHMPTSRIFLHAPTLTLPFPDGTTQTFTSHLPQSLQEACQKLK